MPTFVKIASFTLNASSPSLVFSQIPQTYTNLHIIGSLRGTTSSNVEGITMRFNQDTSTNYLYELLQGYQQFGAGSVVAAGSFSTTFRSSIYCGACAGNSNTANFFSALDIYIPNYKTSYRKRAIIRSAADTTSTANFTWQTDEVNAAWNSTGAITEIEIAPTSGSFAANSSLSLYGTLAA